MARTMRIGWALLGLAVFAGCGDETSSDVRKAFSDPASLTTQGSAVSARQKAFARLVLSPELDGADGAGVLALLGEPQSKVRRDALSVWIYVLGERSVNGRARCVATGDVEFDTQGRLSSLLENSDMCRAVSPTPKP